MIPFLIRLILLIESVCTCGEVGRTILDATARLYHAGGVIEVEEGDARCRLYLVGDVPPFAHEVTDEARRM
jgi:hypothetical protein